MVELEQQPRTMRLRPTTILVFKNRVLIRNSLCTKSTVVATPKQPCLLFRWIINNRHLLRLFPTFILPANTWTLELLPHGASNYLSSSASNWRETKIGGKQIFSCASREIIHVWEKNIIWRWIIDKLLRRSSFWTVGGKFLSTDTQNYEKVSMSVHRRE